uniref:CCHC-type domain-containing protein n=1 Tax=Amphimedon queenslandica TaxID=400682 RepID=A0A1X7VCC8_AMPQE
MFVGCVTYLQMPCGQKAAPLANNRDREPDDPVKFWEKLAVQFQKKTWANKLALRHKLYSLRLKDDVGEEDCVVHLLASLPESYSTLITALEARHDVPTLEVVVEKLLYEDSKLKDCQPEKDPKRFSVRHKSRGWKCHFCHKFGHIQRNCSEKIQSERKSEEKKAEKRPVKHRAHQTQNRRKGDSEDSDSNTATVGLVTRRMLSVNTSG